MTCVACVACVTCVACATCVTHAYICNYLRYTRLRMLLPALHMLHTLLALHHAPCATSRFYQEPAKISATLLHAFLVPTAHALHAAYPRQFRKLLRVMHAKYIPRLREARICGTGGTADGAEERAAVSVLDSFIERTLKAISPGGAGLVEPEASQMLIVKVRRTAVTATTTMILLLLFSMMMMVMMMVTTMRSRRREDAPVNSQVVRCVRTQRRGVMCCRPVP